MFRHLLTFLVALAGIYAVQKMADRRFSDWRIGLLAALFLILTPRLFANRSTIQKTSSSWLFSRSP